MFNCQNIFTLGIVVLLTMLSAGRFGTIAQAGTLDPDFGTAGKVSTDVYHADEPTKTWVLPDGKILVVGQSTFQTGSFPPPASLYALLVRYNSNGSLDTSFGVSGKVHDTSLLSVADAMLQPDGKIVMVGAAGPEFFIYEKFRVIRFNADGTRDTGFGTGGAVTTDIGGAIDVPRGGVILPDGKILVAGTSAGSSTSAGTITLVRYNSNGTLDNTFGVGGILYYFNGPVNSTPPVTDLALLADGKFLVLASSFAARFNPDGSFDPTFGSGGFANGGGTDMFQQPDGKFIIPGAPPLPPTNDNFGLTRRNSDWSMDSSFGVNGFVRIRFRASVGYYQGLIRGIAFKPNGEFYVSGRAYTDSSSGTPVARFTANGVEVAKTVEPFIIQGFHGPIALQPDGKIVVAGSADGVSTVDVGVVRFTEITNDAPVAFRRSYDFDGDGRDDIAVYRPGSGGGNSVWYSTLNGYTTWNFGSEGDIIAPADFTGDGVTDLAVFRPSTGTWYIANSLVNPGADFTAVPWGAAGDVPAVGDFDGDGNGDVAVFRPSDGVWYIRNSQDASFRAVQWGMAGDIPRVGDYDGDGLSDITVYRPSSGTWYILRSSDLQLHAVPFGAMGDIPVAADYDGDSVTDIAVFRPSTGVWYLINSSTVTFVSQNWGTSGDSPAPGDFDGDGKTDFAVVRTVGANGIWHVLNSSNGSILSRSWGLNTDTPVPGK